MKKIKNSFEKYGNNFYQYNHWKNKQTKNQKKH